MVELGQYLSVTDELLVRRSTRAEDLPATVMSAAIGTPAADWRVHE
jgi:hypothetical protein